MGARTSQRSSSGRAGIGCDLEGTATTFPAGVSVRTMLTLEPALPTGGMVTIAVEKDGAEFGAPRTITLTEPAPCVYGTLTDVEVGHYRMIYTIRPSQMPPATGEFDVTPGALASHASPATSDTSIATRIIDRLDGLAELAGTGDELQTANWAIDESDWVTENMSALLAQGGTIESYVDALTAMLDTVADGADQAAVIDRLLDLRDEIATEFALPTLGPTSIP